MCLPPKMYAHVPALVAEWAALGEGGGPDVNGHSHLGAGVANNWSGGFLCGKFFCEWEILVILTCWYFCCRQLIDCSNPWCSPHRVQWCWDPLRNGTGCPANPACSCGEVEDRSLQKGKLCLHNSSMLSCHISEEPLPQAVTWRDVTSLFLWIGFL